MSNCQINEDLLQMAEGIDIPCNLELPKHPPPWLDTHLYHEGQIFFWANPLPVMLCSLRSLLIGMSLPNLCVPLVLTKRSETKEKARSRYNKLSACQYLNNVNNIPLVLILTIFCIIHIFHKIFHRYMETGHHITSWYRMTPWDESVTDDGTLSIN